MAGPFKPVGVDSDSLFPPRVEARLAGTFVAGQAVSTDGTESLPTPSGVGLEFVITAAGLDDIRFDGVSL